MKNEKISANFFVAFSSRSLSNAVKDSESIQANCQSLIEGDPLEALTQEEEILNEVQYASSRYEDSSLSDSYVELAYSYSSIELLVQQHEIIMKILFVDNY